MVTYSLLSYNTRLGKKRKIALNCMKLKFPLFVKELVKILVTYSLLSNLTAIYILTLSIPPNKMTLKEIIVECWWSFHSILAELYCRCFKLLHIFTQTPPATKGIFIAGVISLRPGSYQIIPFKSLKKYF